MHDPHRHSLLLQIQAQQLPHHVRGRLTRVMRIVPTPFTLMPQRDRPAFRTDNHHLRPLAQQPGLEKMMHDEHGPNGRRRVHLHLVLPVRLVKGLGGKVAGGDDEDVDGLGRLDGGGQLRAGGFLGDVDVGDPFEVGGGGGGGGGCGLGVAAGGVDRGVLGLGVLLDEFGAEATACADDEDVWHVLDLCCIVKE